MLRYRVVQPLLNQMVAFGRENLIVFIGQQPNFHYILMDQNQLSPYVKQDGFPLFQHEEDASESEFITLLRKVLTGHVPFDQGFVQAIHAETCGRPWLTVNHLVDFFDWESGAAVTL